MDKLEPILKHHFWILLVPLLSMNLWGYFSANSALTAATSNRQSELDKAKSGVPAGTTDPNEQYATELGKQNDELEKFVKEELSQLWLRQQARMTWPQAVAADIPKGYRSEITDNLVRFAYQSVYAQDVIKPLHESVEPMVLNTKDITYVPKIDFPAHLIPQMKVGNFTITSQQMWDAQEDVWVTQLILDAIRQMNKDADSTSSAVIRRVISYRLLGGDGTPVTAGGASAGATGEDSSMSMSMPMMPGGDPSAGGATGGNAMVQTSVRFNPAEEFGTGGEAAAGASGMGGNSAMMMSMAPSETDGGTTTGATEILRYVKFDPASTVEAAPYMERGFYLSVIINQNKLVDFLVALSNSEWPVKVVRFQMGKNPWKTDEFKAAGLAGGGGMPMGGPMGAMGSMGMAPGLQDSFDSSATPFESGGNGAAEMMGGGLPGGFGGGFGGGAGANTGYKLTDLDHPDLVQLDLAGLVTIFRDPTAEATPADAAPAEGTTEPAAPATADSAPTDGTAPAAEGTPANDAGATAAAEGTPAAETPAAAPTDANPTAPAETATPAPADGAPPAETAPATPPAEPAPSAPDAPANP